MKKFIFIIFAAALWIGVVDIPLTGNCASANVTNIAKLIPSNDLTDAGHFRGVFISNNYAYITSMGGGYLLIYRLNDLLRSDTDLGEITQINSIKIDGQTNCIANKGNYLYLGGSAIWVFDIKKRAKPRLINSISRGSYCSIKVIDDYLIAIDHKTVHIFDISNPSNPSYLRSVGGTNYNSDATIFGSYLYVAEWIFEAGIRIYDITNIYDIQELRFIPLYEDPFEDPYHVEIKNNHLFVASDKPFPPSFGSHLYSFSLDDPTTPLLLDFIGLYVGGRAFGIANEFCVVSGYGIGSVVDITNPSTLDIIGDIDNQGGTADGFPFDVAIYNNLILVGGQDYVLASKFNADSSTDPNIDLTYPDGGNILYKGDDYVIQWDWSNYSGNVRIHAYLNDDFHKTLAADEPVGRGGIDFRPPETDDWPTSDRYKIAIVTVDDLYSDESKDYFSIIPHGAYVYPVDGIKYSKCPGNRPIDLEKPATFYSVVWTGRYQGLASARCEGTAGGHPGVDIRDIETETAKNIKAIGDGTVKEAREESGWGKYVIIEHTGDPTYGTFYSVYAHLSQIKVIKDEQVNIGDLIGIMGKTGTKATHLHFQIDKALHSRKCKEKGKEIDCYKPHWPCIEVEVEKGKETITETWCYKLSESEGGKKYTKEQFQEFEKKVTENTLNPIWLIEQSR